MFQLDLCRDEGGSEFDEEPMATQQWRISVLTSAIRAAVVTRDVEVSQ